MSSFVLRRGLAVGLACLLLLASAGVRADDEKEESPPYGNTPSELMPSTHTRSPR